MERKTCVKCGNGVGLLVCKGSSCPVVVHESCIPGSVQLSDMENFYCPYCMYDRSVAEFEQAREKVVLARRKMAAFLGSETPEDKEFEPNTARYNRRMPQNHEEFDAKGGPKVYECTNGIKVVGDEKNSHLFSKAGGGVLSFGAMRACERRRDNVEYLSPMPLRVAVGGVIRRYGCVNECHEDGSSEKPEQRERGGNACDNPHGDEVRCDDSNIMNCSSSGRIDNPGKRSPSGVASDTKRKRLRWTNEEVDMLKEGVRVYSTGVKKNLPWRKILEFGSHVFNGSRTPTDLKDKWKLIARKENPQSNDE